MQSKNPRLGRGDKKLIAEKEVCGESEITFTNLDVTEWNAEIPTLYTAYITLKKNGEAVQFVRSYIGFKNIKINKNVYYFNDEEAYNLRYCEDMVCLDVGHMTKAMAEDALLIVADTHTIDYVESESEYLRLYLNSGEVVTTLLRLKNIEPILTAGDFMRIHRSYIVNLKHIKAIAKGRVFLSDDVSLPVGDNYREAFNSYIEKVYLNL